MEQFLKEITDCLQQKIKELDEELSAGQQEIKNMHEYYWENYTEMDEYGYENYDNQQALLHQVHANEEKLSKRKRLTKMLESPFFGRVDFRYDGEEESETFYIGIGNFAPRAGMRPLIYDWRAPVSGLFYDYDRGPAAYDAPGGRMEGEITSKWQYKIKNGHMIYGFESDTKIDDEILKQELGSGGDVQLKNIVRTIQKEQNAIIRNTEDRILAIQGAAGSGKTSVALHRIAYLLYHDRENLKAANILILSPNNAFSDYISHILPELGEEHIQEMSFDLFAYKELKEVANDCEDRYDYLEKKMKFQDSEWEIRFKEKQSASFIGQMEGFLAMLEEDLVNIRSFTFKGFHKTEEEIIHLFYFKFQTVPLLARMDAVMEYLIDEYETLRGKNISEEDMEALRETFQKMYVTTDLYEIYGWLLKDCGYPELSNAEYERRKLEYEDVFPMLYLKYRLKGSRKHKNIKHLVIDEMQDYSYLQYSILSMLFHCRMTILGDRAQTMDSECQDVTKFLPKIFGRKIRKIVMNKSYRNTLEIAEYAERIRGGEGLELFQRHGKEVEEFHGLSMEEMLENIEKQVKSANAQYETAAVITMNESDAYDIYRLLKNCQLPVSYMDRDTSVFKKGMTVTTFYLAKGLEFDQVFSLFPAADQSLIAKQGRYIAATRALHKLHMYEYGK